MGQTEVENLVGSLPIVESPDWPFSQKSIPKLVGTGRYDIEAERQGDQLEVVEVRHDSAEYHAGDKRFVLILNPDGRPETGEAGVMFSKPGLDLGEGFISLMSHDVRALRFDESWNYENVRVPQCKVHQGIEPGPKLHSVWITSASQSINTSVMMAIRCATEFKEGTHSENLIVFFEGHSSWLSYGRRNIIHKMYVDNQNIVLNLVAMFPKPCSE
jgi:hypothetical protein